LTLNTSGNGTVIKDPNYSYYNYGTWVKLSATPDTGWHFVNWTGSLSSTYNPDSILMNGDKTITANFAINTYTLTLNINPSGQGNSVNLTPPTGPYDFGTWVKLQPNPATGWYFVNWSDSLTGSNMPDSIYMNGNKVVTANFAIHTYTLTLNTNGNGTATKTPDQATYNYGTYVKLTATADSNWHFVNWTGSFSSSQNPDSVYMDGDKTITANFAINTYILTMNINPSGQGNSVALTPPTGPYTHGTWVKLQPNPATGWHFVGWSDSLTGAGNPDSIYMNSNKVVTATFAINTYTLTVNTTGNGQCY